MVFSPVTEVLRAAASKSATSGCPELKMPCFSGRKFFVFRGFWVIEPLRRRGRAAQRYLGKRLTSGGKTQVPRRSARISGKERPMRKLSLLCVALVAMVCIGCENMKMGGDNEMKK